MLASCRGGPGTLDATVGWPGPDATAADGGIVDPGLELGTGQTDWESLVPGSTVELIHGPQGGYHVFARIRESRLGGDVRVAFRATDADGGRVLNDPTDEIHLLEGRGLLRTAAGWETSNALLVILVQVHAPGDVVGRTLVLEADVIPAGATTPSSVRRVVTVVDDF